VQRGRGLAVAVAAALTLTANAGAGQRIDAAVGALQSSPIYVDPTAELAIGGGDQARLRAAIDASNAGPVYIAILPLAAENETGGNPDGVLQALHDGLKRDGTYAVVVGRHFRAGSEGVLQPGVAGRLATEALDAHRSDGVTATLIDLVLGGALFVGAHAVRTRRRRQAELAEVKAAAHDDLIALADDVQKLEQPVEANAKAKQAYDDALSDYAEASGAYDDARQSTQLQAVASSLEEGRWHMACAEALLAGKPPPERRPPCFFDPRHGPSARDVDWAPPGGATRKVPACQACARAVERGEEPASREVVAGGRSVPYWNAPSYFGPWAGGYFAPFGGTGFLSGLFVGDLLGGAYGGWGYGSWAGSGDSGGFGHWSDFGGGMSFGGGDFGGGGGGDF
jgi:uncharacterized membrane protein YgcG